MPALPEDLRVQFVRLIRKLGLDPWLLVLGKTMPHQGPHAATCHIFTCSPGHFADGIIFAVETFIEQQPNHPLVPAFRRLLDEDDAVGLSEGLPTRDKGIPS